jgi:CRP-like cAMP-binding protein
LSDASLTGLLPYVTNSSYEDGDVVEPAQDPGCWFHVISGLVCSSMGSGASIECIDLFGPGTWLCPTATIPQASATFQSLASTRVLHLPSALAQEVFTQEHSLANFIVKLVEWRSHTQAEMLMISKAGDPSGRVLLRLALLTHCLASSSSHLPGKVPEGSLRIPIKQVPLASYLGVSRGLLSGCLRKLSAGGWLQVGYGYLDILKPQVWNTLYASHTEDASGFYRQSMDELLLTMRQLEGSVHA